MPTTTNVAQPNFYLWGTWRNRTIKEPFLVKKVALPIKKVVLNDTCVVALTETGDVMAFGKDSNGCLGLGFDADSPDKPITSQELPKKVEGLANIVDIQMGRQHVVALSSTGEVYCWGSSAKGQLGTGMTGGTDGDDHEFEPRKVGGELTHVQIMQIAVVKNSTFALSTGGVVYAWGENVDGVLGMEDRSRTLVASPTQLKELQEIGRLEVYENRTIIAYCRNTQLENLEDFMEDAADTPEVLEVFKGIDVMRKAVETTQTWWYHLVNIQHGRPYENTLDRPDVAGENLGQIRDDMDVEIKVLKEAEKQLSVLLNDATKEMERLRKATNTKTVWLILCMFIDDCRLRREKVQHMISSRQLRDITRTVKDKSAYSITDFGANANEEIRRIIAVTKDLQEMLEAAKKVDAVDVPISAFKGTLILCLECKLQLHDTRIELLKAAESKPSNPMLPALRTIKDRWHSLKQFSLYALYKECDEEQRVFDSDNDHLAFLVRESNKRIDQILQIQDDRAISRDTLVPSLCYDLLQENAELRKMTHAYQLHVLMLYEGKNMTNMTVGINMRA